MSKTISAAFDGHAVQFRDDGWFNATSAAAKFGKRVDHYFSNVETGAYVAALCEGVNTRNPGDLVKTKRGANGGTWLHPELAVHFARWLDMRFAIWCDRQIRDLVQSRTDWQAARSQVKQEHGHLMSMLKLSRSLDGKDTQAHHCINEARVCRYAMTGSDDCEGWDRENLSRDALALLAQVEGLETVLVIRGVPYEERKAQCRALVLKARGQLLEATC